MTPISCLVIFLPSWDAKWLQEKNSSPHTSPPSLPTVPRFKTRIRSLNVSWGNNLKFSLRLTHKKMGGFTWFIFSEAWEIFVEVGSEVLDKWELCNSDDTNYQLVHVSEKSRKIVLIIVGWLTQASKAAQTKWIWVIKNFLMCREYNLKT